MSVEPIVLFLAYQTPRQLKGVENSLIHQIVAQRMGVAVLETEQHSQLEVGNYFATQEDVANSFAGTTILKEFENSSFVDPTPAPGYFA